MFEPGEGPGRERLTGFFDFYFAGCDTWLFDLAVCLNDWCIDLTDGRLVEERAAVLVAAYESERPLSGAEHRLLPALLRAGGFALLAVAPVRPASAPRGEPAQGP
jgi:homoserine kinase type II